MAKNTLNVSLPAGQLSWVRDRKDRGDYKTLSDVIQELIREKQETEAQTLKREFDRLQPDGAAGREPVGRIVSLVRKVKRERLANRGA